MSMYSPYRRGFGYYLKRIIFVSVLLALGFYAPDIMTYYNRLDSEKILAASTFKNKTFSTPVQEIKSSGMTAYLLEEHSVPIVSIDFKFGNAGVAHEDEEKQGLVRILSSLLIDGAGKYDAEAFKDTCEEYGIKIGFDYDNDDFSGYLYAPRKNLPKALEMLTAVLQKPRFDKEFMTLRKEQLKTAIKSKMENPEAVLAEKFSGFIFAGHPYSRKAMTVLKTLDNVSEDDLLKFMQTHLSRENLIISFAGDLTKKDVKDILKSPFAELPEKYAGEKMNRIELKLGGREKNVKYKSAQAISFFATNGTYREAEDYYPLYLANYIFGGSGLNSRISQIIREKEGLTYGIATYLQQNDAVALLTGSYSSTPDNFRKAQNLLLEQWQKMAQEGISDKELQQTKESLISSFNLRFASISGIASMLTGMQQYNLGRDFLEKRNDYIKAVTLDEVNAAAKKYFGTKPDFVNIDVKNKGE